MGSPVNTVNLIVNEDNMYFIMITPYGTSRKLYYCDLTKKDEVPKKLFYENSFQQIAVSEDNIVAKTGRYQLAKITHDDLQIAFSELNNNNIIDKNILDLLNNNNDIYCIKKLNLCLAYINGIKKQMNKYHCLI